MYTFKDLQDEVKRRSTRNQSNTEFNTATKNIINTSLFRVAREAPWKVLRRSDTFDTETSYTTGSGAVAVTNGSKSVSVTGATLITDGIEVGRHVNLGGSQLNYIIKTITSETTFTVDINYDGTTSTTQTYEVLPRETYNQPIQTSRPAIIWHENFGFPFVLEYTPEIEFLRSTVDIATTGTPTNYRMWGENFIQQQPNSASVVTISSSSSSDTGVGIRVHGIVSGLPDSEKIMTNASDGTTAVAGTKSFSKIERITKDATTEGRITCTTNSAGVTVTTLPAGDTTAGTQIKKIQLWPLPDKVFPVHVFYYKEPWRLVDDDDVHEMGQEFDELIILLSVAKIQFETNQREGEAFFSMYKDELATLRRLNADKLDWLTSLRRMRDNPRATRAFVHRFLGFNQLGGFFGPMLHR